MNRAATGPEDIAITPIGWLRVGLRSIGLFIVLAASLPLYAVCRPFTRHNPAPSFFFKGVCRVLGIRVRRTGQVSRRGTFLISNHVSWLDIPVLCALSGTAFIAHDGLAEVSWLRWLCRLNDTVFVARHDRASVAMQVEQVREAVRDTGALTIFAEGTTGYGDELRQFKSSLLSAITPLPPGLSVQPVWLDYGSLSRTIAWVGDEHGGVNFLKVAARTAPVELTVHFLSPLSEEAQANRKTLAAAAHSAILARMTRAA